VESISGPPRKYFVLTEEGQKAFGVLLNTWNDMANAVNQLTQSANQPSNSSSTATSEENHDI
jgi:PadR family transcriptional regulator PadR